MKSISESICIYCDSFAKSKKRAKARTLIVFGDSCNADDYRNPDSQPFYAVTVRNLLFTQVTALHFLGLYSKTKIKTVTPAVKLLSLLHLIKKPLYERLVGIFLIRNYASFSGSAACLSFCISFSACFAFSIIGVMVEP